MRAYAIGLMVSLGLTACDGTSRFVESESQSPIASKATSPGSDAVGQVGDDGTGTGSDGTTTVDDKTPEDKGEITPDGTGGSNGGGGAGGGSGSAHTTHWSFNSSTYLTSSVSYAPQTRELSQSLVMDNNVVKAQKDFAQIDRPVYTEVFAQGSYGTSTSETFKQTSSASGLLDILLVVDNSSSMKEEQQNLSGKLSPLLTYVQSSDWRIGVVTTDPKDGCLRGLIAKGDQNASTAFATAVSPGISGSGNERGILQAVNGLKGECNPNGSWLRPQSTVAVLIVSDEDNCSANGADCGSDPWAKSAYLTNYLQSIRNPGVNARVYGLIGHPSLSSSQCKTMANKATQYAEVIDQTGGTWGSICDADYSSTLQAVSKDLSAILLTQFNLKYKPDNGSVKITVNGTTQTSGYSVQGNIISFDKAPSSNAQISVSYTYSADVPKTDFALREKADGSSAKVYLDGVETKSFTFDANANAIHFAAAPKSGAAVKVVYRKGVDLTKEFALGADADASSIAILVNGVAMTKADFSFRASDDVVVFTKAPADKSNISIMFNSILAHRLVYPVAFNNLDAVSVTDAVSGAKVNAVRNGDSLVFAEADYAPGRTLNVKASMGTVNWSIDLPADMRSETLKVVSVAGKACTNYVVLGNKMDLKNCGYSSSDKVSISFSYEAEHHEEFTLGTPDSIPQDASWQVAVNGVLTSGYTLENGEIRFASLPRDAKIEITMQALMN